MISEGPYSNYWNLKDNNRATGNAELKGRAKEISQCTNTLFLYGPSVDYI